MSDDYTYLYNLAKKATKGQWHAVGYHVENERDDLPDICRVDDVAGRENPDENDDHDKQMCIDAEYIAAAQPKQILDMITEIRSLRKIIDNARG